MVNPTYDPAALAIDDLARVLSTAGGRHIPSEWLQDDVASGAPTNPDGTVNLVRYAAWLAKEARVGD